MYIVVRLQMIFILEYGIDQYHIQIPYRGIEFLQ